MSADHRLKKSPDRRLKCPFSAGVGFGGQRLLYFGRRFRAAEPLQLQNLFYGWWNATTPSASAPGYDATGNLLRIEGWVGSSAAGEAQAFGYDALHRLTSAVVTGGSGGAYNETYGYSPNGNLTAKAGVAVAYTDPAHVHAATHVGGAPRAAYDANGNMTTRIESGVTYTQTWDKEHRLERVVTSSGQTTTFMYDADGQRLRRVDANGATLTIGNDYEVTMPVATATPTATATPAATLTPTPGPTATATPTATPSRTPTRKPKSTETPNVPTDLVARAAEVKAEDKVEAAAKVELQAAGAPVITKYYYLGGQRVAMRQGGTLYYLFSDHLGSTSLVTNASGGEVGRQLYTPFGAPRVASGTLLTERKFTGQRSEEATLGSLYDYGARFYSPILGRFLSADSIVPRPGDPQSLNRYAYARNNPVKYRDPSGHWIETAWDVLNIGWDIYEVKQDPSLLNIGALVVDVAAAVIPVIPAGAGLTARGGKAAVGVASHADEVAEATKIGGKVVEEAAVSAAKRAGRQVSREVVEQAIKSKVGSARELLRERVPGTEVHHLIKQRFAEKFGVKAGDLPAIRLDKTFHQQEVTSRLFSKGNLPTGGTYSLQKVWNTYKDVYGKELGRQDWLDVIWPFFVEKGVIR